MLAQTTTKIKQTIHSKIKNKRVFRYYVYRVSLQRSSLDFRNSKTHQMEHKKLSIGISILVISIFENTTDEINDVTHFI